MNQKTPQNINHLSVIICCKCMSYRQLSFYAVIYKQKPRWNSFYSLLPLSYLANTVMKFFKEKDMS